MDIDPLVMQRQILPDWNFWGWNNDKIHRQSEIKKATYEREIIKLQHQLFWVKFASVKINF